MARVQEIERAAIGVHHPADSTHDFIMQAAHALIMTEAFAQLMQKGENAGLLSQKFLPFRFQMADLTHPMHPEQISDQGGGEETEGED